jgi:3-isopropylmalate dehydrogenase
MRQYKIAILAGDGVGPEVIREGVKVIRTALDWVGMKVEFVEMEMGYYLYQRTGVTLSKEAMDEVMKSDAIYFGAIGVPGVQAPLDRSPLGQLRKGLDLYANVRPSKLYKGVESPLRFQETGHGVDYVIFRENSEGLYNYGKGEFIVRDEVAISPLIVSRKGTERIVRAAFKAATRRKGAPADGVRRVACVDKANSVEAYAYFRKVFDEVAKDYPDIKVEHIFTDAMTVYMIQKPGSLDVLVTENMFGDILSDLGSATVGGLGLAPSMEIGDRHGLFQPIHGSAPDIAGRNIVNPIAAILSGAMMFEWLGDRNKDVVASGVARRIEEAVEKVLADRRVRTQDLGGRSSTTQVGDAVAEEITKGTPKNKK